MELLPGADTGDEMVIIALGGVLEGEESGE